MQVLVSKSTSPLGSLFRSLLRIIVKRKHAFVNTSYFPRFFADPTITSISSFSDFQIVLFPRFAGNFNINSRSGWGGEGGT